MQLEILLGLVLDRSNQSSAKIQSQDGSRGDGGREYFFKQNIFCHLSSEQHLYGIYACVGTPTCCKPYMGHSQHLEEGA